MSLTVAADLAASVDAAGQRLARLAVVAGPALVARALVRVVAAAVLGVAQAGGARGLVAERALPLHRAVLRVAVALGRRGGRKWTCFRGQKAKATRSYVGKNTNFGPR